MQNISINILGRIVAEKLAVSVPKGYSLTDKSVIRISRSRYTGSLLYGRCNALNPR